MKLGALAFSLYALALAPCPQSNAAELSPALSSCIHDNAPKVELAIPSLSEATAFLVTNLCADALATQHAEDAKQMYQHMLDNERQACEKQRAAQPSNEHSSSSSTDYTNSCQLADMYAAMINTGFTGVVMHTPTSAPASATSLAAKLLLDLRLARQAREGHH